MDQAIVKSFKRSPSEPVVDNTYENVLTNLKG